MPMDPRMITDRYHVSPQIDPEDAQAIRDAGYSVVICNRPDAEVPPSHQYDALKSALEAVGVSMVPLPVTHQTLSPQIAQDQHAAIDGAGDGKVLAYCASGTRSTIVWALGAAGSVPTDEIIARAAEAGYDISGMRATLDSLATG